MEQAKLVSLIVIFTVLNVCLPASAATNFKQSIVSNDFSGEVKVVSRQKKGFSKVDIFLDRFSPEIEDDIKRGDVIEVWLVDSGIADDQGATSSNANDSEGASFNGELTDAGATLLNSSGGTIAIANVPLNNLMEAAPYALSLGRLREIKKGRNKGNFALNFKTVNSLAPYDYILITLEKNGNLGDYDPRPGKEITRIDLELK